MDNENAVVVGDAEPVVAAAVIPDAGGETAKQTTEPVVGEDGRAASAAPTEELTEVKPEDEGKIAKDEIPGLTENAQEKVNERIHEINIRRKNAEATLAEKEKELNETNERLKSLEALSDEQLVNVARRTGLLPQYLEKEDSKVVEEYESLKGYRCWLREHRGMDYEGTGEKDPSMTAREIAQQEIRVEDRLEEIGVKARNALERGTNALREDLMEGQKIRRARKTKIAEKKITLPPVLPRGKGPAGGPPISGTAKARAIFNQEEFIKKGANSSALEEQYLKILG